MKVTIKGFVNYTKGYDGSDRYSVETFSMGNSANYTEVCPIELEIDIPNGWSPEKAEIESLITKKAQYIQQFHDSIAKIDQRLSELSALEYTPEAEVTEVTE